MKAIYALVAACVSLQACIAQSETPTISTNINEYSSIVEYVGAVPLYDDHDYTAHEYTAAITTPPSIKPIDGAEFEGTSRDDANTLWVASLELRDEIDAWTGGFDYTGVVTAPKPIVEQAADLFATGEEDGNTAYSDREFYGDEWIVLGEDDLHSDPLVVSTTPKR